MPHRHPPMGTNYILDFAKVNISDSRQVCASFTATGIGSAFRDFAAPLRRNVLILITAANSARHAHMSAVSAFLELSNLFNESHTALRGSVHQR